VLLWDSTGPIPTCILITSACQHDVFWLDELVFEPGAFYVMDRGYMDFKRLDLIARSGSFFVTRAKDSLRFSRQRSQPVEMKTGLRSDQIGKPTLPDARQDFPSLLRKARFFDEETARDLVFPTNNLDIPALTVATIYRLRWQIELFFRWIKGHLRIKHYYGTGPNAVKTQIWIAACVYLMVAIIHKQIDLHGTPHRTLKLLSVHPFEKTPLHQLLAEADCNISISLNHYHSHCSMNNLPPQPSFDAKFDRCFNVAIDHGLFNEFGFLSGIDSIHRDGIFRHEVCQLTEIEWQGRLVPSFPPAFNRHRKTRAILESPVSLS